MRAEMREHQQGLSQCTLLPTWLIGGSVAHDQYGQHPGPTLVRHAPAEIYTEPRADRLRDVCHERWSTSSLKQGSCDRFTWIIRGWMPTASYPPTTGALDCTIMVPIIIHVETLNRRSPSRCSSDDGLSISRPDEMFGPPFAARMKKWNTGLGHRINTIRERVTATVATVAGKGEVVLFIAASQ